MNLNQTWQLFSNKRIVATLLLAFSSGLPFSLTGATLQAWLTKSGVSIQSIGFMGLVGLPYVFKFLWAPIMDRFVPPFMGRRRGWIMLVQAALAVGLFCMGLFNPHEGAFMLGLVALLVAFLSASQDIVVDAYRVDLLPPQEYGLGMAMTVGGYRIAIIVSGALAMALAYYIGWHITYFIMAGVMLACTIVTWFSPELIAQPIPPRSLKQAVIEPFLDFLKRDKIMLILLLIATYKIGDMFAQSLSTAFLIRGVGFNLLDVASMNKVLGVVSVIVGTFVGGILLSRISMFKGLIYFGIVQALSNLMFMWLAIVGKSYWLLAASVFAENFCSGLGTSAFFSLLMSLCNKRYSATQYALLSALFGAVRVFISPLAGFTVTHWGWVNFFVLSFFISLPALLLVVGLRANISTTQSEAYGY